MAFISTPVVANMKEIGKKISSMALVVRFGRTVLFTKESIFRAKSKVLGRISGLMALSTQDNGIRIILVG